MRRSSQAVPLKQLLSPTRARPDLDTPVTVYSVVSPKNSTSTSQQMFPSAYSDTRISIIGKFLKLPEKKKTNLKTY